MKCLTITHRGFADIAALEVKELIGKESTTEDTIVLFDAKEDELLRLYYRSQTAIRIMQVLEKIQFENLEDIDPNFEVTIEGSFAVRCVREGHHDFKANDVERQVGAYIHERFKVDVDLENPDTLILCYIYDNDCHIGIDHAGFDLSKRHYHIFNAPGSLRGSFANCLVRLSDYKIGEKLADCFARAGDIPLEAAHFATKRSPHFFSKDRFSDKFTKTIEEQDKLISENSGRIMGYDNQLRYVKAAQKNAKIAGIQKDVSFVRGDVDWLDTKFKEGELNRLVSYPPQVSKIRSAKEIAKTAKELFYHLDFVLNGKAVLLLRNPLPYITAAEEHGFKHEERAVWQGQEQFFAIVFEKNESKVFNETK